MDSQSSSSSSSSTFPPLPNVPEPPIFDAPYYPTLLAVFSDASFSVTTTAEHYHARLQFVQAIIASRNESSRSLSIALLVAWVSMVLLCGVLLVRIRRNRQRALLGDAHAAHRIVLPAFEPLLWMLGGANLIFILSYSALLIANDFVVYHDRVTVELAVGVKQINGLLVVVYMLQPSLSPRALLRAVALAIVLSGYTIVVVAVLNAVATKDNQRRCYWSLVASRFLLVLYLVYWMAYPPARASVRSFRILCLYVVTMIVMMYGMAEAYHRGATDVAKAVGWVIAFYSMFLPLCVWHVLRADTEHWRGIGKRAVELQDTFRRKKGKIDERVSSQGLHVLIEMHRKFIIDFARLQLRDPIADGGDHRNKAMVYRGFLNSKKTPVAIKVYMPADVTEETVAAFSHEAALCGALVHPNILQFYGLCVCPPNICLVTELCQGSLQEAIDARAACLRRGHPVPTHRQQMLVNIGYMIDAARALAYLHSFSPPFVHRDIKPSSFLIDENGTVKLTDFGASRTLSVRPAGGHQPQSSLLVDSAAGRDVGSTGQTVLQVSGDAQDLDRHTAQYMAPEVIVAHSNGTSIYGEAADVFSLGMMMWDILHPGQRKYTVGATALKATTSFRRHPKPSQRDASVYELVCAGHRPAVDPFTPIGLQELMDAAWQTDPRLRPTAQVMVTSLETLQEVLGAAFALKLHDEMTGSSAQQTSFAGIDAVATLSTRGFVDSYSEAIRIGNMFMDCGFLHHTQHARSFANTSAQYVFDCETILSHQSLPLLESEHAIDDTPQAIVPQRRETQRKQPSIRSKRSNRARVSSHGSQALIMEHRCVCRQLGQRLETEQTAGRRHRLRFKLFSDENLVTARLLNNDGESPHRSGARDGFVASRTPSSRCVGGVGIATSDVV